MTNRDILLDKLKRAGKRGVTPFDTKFPTSFRTRISELRAQGFAITDEFVKSPNDPKIRYKKYFLESC